MESDVSGIVPSNTVARILVSRTGIFAITSCDADKDVIFEDAKSCDNYWDENIVRARSGDAQAGMKLFRAISNGTLVPPGRYASTYDSERREDDLRYFYRFALQPFDDNHTIFGGSFAHPIQAWLNVGAQELSDKLIDDIHPYIYDGRDAETWELIPTTGICTERAGIRSDDPRWVDACISILETDNVLTTQSEFFESIPAGVDACENLDGVNS